MKKIYAICALIITTVFTANVYAQTAAATPVDPTLQFFTALSACTPGNYTEANSLTAVVGPTMLNQQIMGQDSDNNCAVQLTTPDNRALQCSFPMASLSMCNDQHFLQGMLEDDVRDPSQDSLNADLQWSQLLQDNCYFGG